MPSQVSEYKDFDAAIFECLERALSTIGLTQKESVLSQLNNQFHVSSKNVGKDPSRVEASLRTLLGPSVAAFVITHTLENIATTFKVSTQYVSTLAEAIDLARAFSGLRS
jgi:hypothetical protein